MKRSPVRRRRPGAPRRGPSDVAANEFRNPQYLKWLREECTCHVCHDVECDPAHGPVNGTSSKGPDAGAIPLCRYHHREQHKIRWPEFEKRYQFSREREAAVYWTAYRIVAA